ncbi:MAG TPA: FKBP-type peptidyl-prolyl cis-trans isomerase [Edaphocola sp.]|nr:FKBP-type peptidyl-prolyl cis-trans isomerase [Edaphocola sp.]
MGIADFLSKRKDEKAKKNLEGGIDFLEANKNKPNIVCLDSGLQYEVLQEGEGAHPTAQSSVTCHYIGTTINGTVFDSSILRGQPATFPLNRVISGWTEGVQLMSPGSKFRFYIPSHLAYGDRQVGSHIEPNSTLIFEIELISFQ